MSLSRSNPQIRPFSIRLTDAEKSLLAARAGHVPLGTYIRDLVLSDNGQEKPHFGNRVADRAALAQVLAALGKSRLSSNLNQLSKAVNIGVLPITLETEAEISDACRAVISMRVDLIRALGLREGGRP